MDPFRHSIQAIFGRDSTNREEENWEAGQEALPDSQKKWSGYYFFFASQGFAAQGFLTCFFPFAVFPFGAQGLAAQGFWPAQGLASA